MEREGKHTLLSPYEDIDLLDQGPTSMSLFNLNYFFWASSLAIAVLGSKNVSTSLGDTFNPQQPLQWCHFQKILYRGTGVGRHDWSGNQENPLEAL